ncbi:MAG: signal peptidase I [Microthrixaceae bacterium]
MHPALPTATPSTASFDAEVDALLAEPRPPGLDAVALCAGGLHAASVFTVMTMAILALCVVLPVLFLGWEATAVESGSMQPALNRGDVVVLKPEPRPAAVGTVVRFHTAGHDATTLHRIVAVDHRRHTYTTRGDANPTVDTDAVPFDAVDGEGVLVVPLLGYPILWLHEANLGALAMLLVGLAVVGLGATRGWATDSPPGGRRALTIPGRPHRGLFADTIWECR